MKQGYLYLPLGEHAQILQVEPQSDGTLKVVRILFDNKAGKGGYIQHKVGDFLRRPMEPFPAKRIIPAIFTTTFQRFLK